MTKRAFLALGLFLSAVAAEEASLESTDAPAVRRIYRLPAGRTESKRPAAKRARVAGRDLILVDVDGDGTFDERNVDGWTLPGLEYLFPVEDRIALGAAAVKLDVDGDRVEFEVASSPPERTAELAAECNRQRMAHGLTPLWLDPRRARGCLDHARYMDRYGLTKVEDPSRAEYTKGGAEMGRQALVMRAAAPAVATEAIFRSFPNRIWLFHPRLGRFGVGVGEGHTAIDIAAPLARRSLVWPVLLPAPGSRDNPTGLYATKPALFGGAARGLPITLQFPGTDIREVTAELRAKGARGKPLEIFVAWPEKPAAPSIRGNAESICVIPKRELDPGVTYSIEVRYVFAGEAGERSWTFRTAGAAARKPAEGAGTAKWKERAPLRPYRLKRRPLFFFVTEADPPEELHARRAKIGRNQVVFLDLDGNGRFGDRGADGWMLGGEHYAFPLEERMVLGDQDVAFVVEADQVQFTRTTVPVRKRYRKALVSWNALRRRHGLPPATLRPEYCTHCEQHARYIDLNGLHAAEDADRQGYTPEGDRVGRRANLVGLSDFDSALPFWERRFGGCRVLYSPHAWEAGAGLGSTNAVLDPLAHPRQRAWRRPVLIPAPESEGNPVASAATAPVMFPDQLRDAAAVGRAGSPIMLFFEEGRAGFDRVDAELREGGRQGKRVEVLVAWPGKPAYREVASNYHAILVLPRKRLRKKTRYEVAVRYGRGGKADERRWWFRTGSR